MADSTVNETLEDDEPFGIHDAYLSNRACGLENDLSLGRLRAQDIGTRLRGISGITAVLMTDQIDINLGAYIRGALVEAIQALADDCTRVLEEENARQRKERETA